MVKDCGHKVPCGCEDKALTTPAPCGDGIDCEGTPCSETFDANCIYYTGEPILCETDEVVTSNMSLADAIAAVIAYFCNTAAHELPSQLECVIPGEVPVTEIVSPAGSTLDETLQNIVAYFCDKSNDINNQLAQLTIDVGNLQSIDHSGFVNGNIVSGTISAALPNGCVTTAYGYQLTSGGGIVGDTLQFSITNCPTDAICDDAEEILPGDPIPATANVLMCDQGDPKLVNADRFALADDIPQVCSFILTDVNATTDNLVACRNGTDIINISYQALTEFLHDGLFGTNNYGLFSQITNSPVINDVNPSDTLFGTGEGSLTVDPTIPISAGGYIFERGDAFRLFGAGHLSNVAPSSTLRLEVLFNASVELTLDIPVDVTADLHWNLEIDFVVRTTGGGGSVMTSARFTNEDDSGADAAHTHMATQLAPLNTNIANTLDVRATWLVPQAGDEIYSEMMNLHKIY